MPEQASRRGLREPRPRQCSRERLRAPVVTDGPRLGTEEISPLGRQTRSLDSVRLLPGRPKAQGTGVGGTGKAGDALGPHARLHLPAPRVSPGEIQHHGQSPRHGGFSTTDRPRAPRRLSTLERSSSSHPAGPCHRPVSHTHTADIPGPLWPSPGRPEPHDIRPVPKPTRDMPDPASFPWRLPSRVRPGETPLPHRSVHRHLVFRRAPFLVCLGPSPRSALCPGPGLCAPYGSESDSCPFSPRHTPARQQ